MTGAPDAGVMDASEVVVDGGGAVADAGFPDATTGPCNTDPDCASCAADGECCFFSINCQPGSICNTAFDDYYDPSEPEDVCIRVICTSDAECDPGEQCTLEGLCAEAVCWQDSSCPAGQVCIGGRCEAPPVGATSASCEVVSHRYVLTPGQQVPFEAVVRDADGQPLLLPVTADSSDDEVATVSGRSVVAADSGTAQITASHRGSPCSGAIEVLVLGSLPPVAGRVTAVWSDDGAPVTGAAVTVTSAGLASAQVTGADGVAVFSNVSGLEAVTVEADPVFVTVVSPGSSDVVVQVPRPLWPEAGGLRGVVDISQVPNQDLMYGLVGAAQPANVLDFGRQPLVGPDLMATEFDAPELGVEEIIDMPGGMIMGLGSKDFTDDDLRCAGLPARGAQEKGCYLFTVPRGVKAAWTFTGELRLSRVTSIANELAGGMEGPATAVLTSRLLRELYHGADPLVSPARRPRIPATSNVDCGDPLLAGYLDQCRPDYSGYRPHRLVAAHQPSTYSVVSLPDLPATSATGCAGYASVTAVADLGVRGLVPLGLIAAADQLDETVAPDCRVAGDAQPFGPQSEPIQDGQVGLSIAPLHSGLEGHPVRLVATATPLGEGANTARSVLMQTVPAPPERLSFAGAFPAFPAATITNGVVDLQLEPQADFVRFEAFQGRRRWVVHAPAASRLTLPQVAATTAILQNMDAASVLSLRGPTFGRVWAAGADLRFAPNAAIEGYASRRITP